MNTLVNWHRVALVALLTGLFFFNVFTYDEIRGLNFNITHFNKLLSGSNDDKILIKSVKALIEEDIHALRVQYGITAAGNILGLLLIGFTIKRWRTRV